MAGLSLSDRLKSAWNVFMNPRKDSDPDFSGYSYRPDRTRYIRGGERTIIASIYNRIAMDVSAVNMMHVRLDDDGRYFETIESSLNACLTLEANIDQTARAFVQDIVMSMFDEGTVAVVPIDTDSSPYTGAYEILSMRTGKIVEWYPDKVKVRVYNERRGEKEDVVFPKRMVAIIENPLYAVMNEPNSTMQRLIRKLNLLDVVDEQSGSGKLNMIIQLPYIIKSEARRKQAEERRKEIERQLEGSKFGIAYTDGTENVTQLSKPLENNLMGQVEYLTNLLYSELGITTEVLNGSADEKVMMNYQNRTIEPILSAITDEFNRKFLTKTARTQKQAIRFFRDPFRLVPISNIADIADKFTRNEIMTANEIRQIVGMKPAGDPNADRLLNKNMPFDKDSGNEMSGMPTEQVSEDPNMTPEDPNMTSEAYQSDLDNERDRIFNDTLSSLELQVDQIASGVDGYSYDDQEYPDDYDDSGGGP